MGELDHGKLDLHIQFLREHTSTEAHQAIQNFIAAWRDTESKRSELYREPRVSGDGDGGIVFTIDLAGSKLFGEIDSGGFCEIDPGDERDIESDPAKYDFKTSEGVKDAISFICKD